MAVASNERKPNSVGQFLRESASELKKVVWPSREETQRLTLAVVSISLAIGVILGAFDWVFTQLVTMIQRL